MDKQVEKFLEFHGKKVYFLSAEGEWWIAIKPICEALNLKYEHYRERLQNDPILGQLPRNHGVVAADGKMRQMVCLPERFIYGWLFTINSTSAGMVAYKLECYETLFKHFHGSITERTTAIRERALAMAEMNALRKDLADQPKYQRLMQLEGVVLHTSKSLKQQDRAIESEQLQLFAAQQN